MTAFTLKSVMENAQDLLPDTIRLRREIHREPETAFEERKTAARLLESLDLLGLSIRSGVGGTGIIADLVVDPNAPFVALRADMDALPATEESGVEYASATPGKAHLCGHDAHMSMLVAAARILTLKQGFLKRNVRFLFQPSEEKPPGGAPRMIEAGCLDRVEAVYGLHVDPRFPVGTFASRVGPMLAQSDRFDITIEGKGGHGSMPHLTVDPVVVAAHLVTALQTIPSRRARPADPIVLSVCRISAGETFNAIPARAELTGTARSLSAETGRRLPEWIARMAESTAAAWGARADVRYEKGYPPVVNHAEGVSRAKAACEALKAAPGGGGLRFEECEPTLYGEDFAYYLQKAPGAFVFIGVGNEREGIVEPCHSPRFRIDEAALGLGPAFLAQIALSFT